MSVLIQVYLWCLGTQTELTMMDITRMESTKNKLHQQLQVKTWGVHMIKNDDKAVKFYTGLPSFAIFMWLFK
jgi:hypothetical protein